MAPLGLKRGHGAMQETPRYARCFADLPYTPPNPVEQGFGPWSPKGFFERLDGARHRPRPPLLVYNLFTYRGENYGIIN